MECYFCYEEGTENGFSFKLCEFKYSKLYLYKEQIYPGRVILAAKSHVPEYFDMNREEMEGYISELTMVSQAIRRAFKPDKLNYCSIGDSSGHLHVHIVPKRKDNEMWGDMFEVNAHRGFLEHEAYQPIIDRIMAEIPKDGITEIYPFKKESNKTE